MIFQFTTGSVTFFDEDREYYEKRLSTLKKFLGDNLGDEDTVHLDVKLEKNKHASGEKFDAHAHMRTPNHGDFYAEVSEENMKKCADVLEDKLKTQIKKFREKQMGK